ncbi:lysophospholipid acyltransferase family protein [Sandarakinorhabdus sp. AAP62]|uniref:lysophospholipid acyltransferase family protein n=1 Tax=Sandarakinorhabdus sp. AAP62 TaxID=1248916 RepID=UPI0003101329|nr:lysophospholipid acyltransferase family protein [Sandarakinorhabdus sp. AAP62]
MADPVSSPTAETWPPPLPDASGFVAPPVPGLGGALGGFAGACARDPAGALRVIARSLWLLAIAAVCVPAHSLHRRLGIPSPWARRFLGWSARACGISVRSIGQPVSRNVFYIANHLSWTDALILGGQTGTVFVAQDGIAIWPGLAFICRLNDTIFVNRSDRMGVPAQIAAMRTQFMRHSRIAMFPEATCSDGRRLLPFKAPLFAMLIPPPPGATLQPVVIDCDEAGRNLAWVGMETGAANAWRLLSRPGTWEVRVHFLEPFSPADLPDRKALSARARTAIAAKLSETLGGRAVA